MAPPDLAVSPAWVRSNARSICVSSQDLETQMCETKKVIELPILTDTK